MDSDTEAKRGRKWRSERARVREFRWKRRDSKNPMLARSLPHLFLSLPSVCGISRCSSETPAESDANGSSPSLSLCPLRKIFSFRLPSSLRGRQKKKKHLIPPSKPLSFPFFCLQFQFPVESGSLLIEIPLHFEDSLTFFNRAGCQNCS